MGALVDDPELRRDESVAVARPAARRGDHAEVLITAAAVFAGLGLRLWIASRPLGAIDSDSAVVGLMARHLLDGEFSSFYWGQAYGGSIEPAVVAGAGAVFGFSPLVLKLVPAALSGVVAVLCWQLGRPLIGERAARLGGLLFWVWPAAFVWWSTKAGPYWAGLCLTLLAAVLLVRLPQTGRWHPAAATGLGVAAGLAWWANPQAVYILVPFAAVYGARLARHWRSLPLVLAGGLAGALPWLVYNVRNDWMSFRVPPQPPSGFGDNLGAFFDPLLPMALGLRVPFTREWLLPVLAPALYAALLALFAVALARRWRSSGGGRALFAVAIAYPFVFSALPTSWFRAHPRYLLFLAPAVALLLAWVAGRNRVAAAGVLLAAALSTVAGLRGMEPANPSLVGGVPARFSALEHLLAAEGVRFAFADYWVAYRAAYETEERVTFTPLTAVRYRPYDRAVRGSRAPAYVFLRRSASYAAFLEGCARLGVPVRVAERGDFAVVLPARKVLPEDVPGEWRVA